MIKLLKKKRINQQKLYLEKLLKRIKTNMNTLKKNIIILRSTPIESSDIYDKYHDISKILEKAIKDIEEKEGD